MCPFRPEADAEIYRRETKRVAFLPYKLSRANRCYVSFHENSI